MLNLIWVLLQILIGHPNGALNRQLDMNLEIREVVWTRDSSCKSHQLKSMRLHYSNMQFWFEWGESEPQNGAVPIFYGEITP